MKELGQVLRAPFYRLREVKVNFPRFQAGSQAESPRLEDHSFFLGSRKVMDSKTSGS